MSNTKNAVESACEKYHVHNSKELTYIWEAGTEDAVREKEKYLQTNEELDYDNSRLVRRLKDYQLYDAKVRDRQSGSNLSWQRKWLRCSII